MTVNEDTFDGLVGSVVKNLCRCVRRSEVEITFAEDRGVLGISGEFRYGILLLVSENGHQKAAL
jgi:hypothetical protein